jgi:hypothetical protein
MLTLELVESIIVAVNPMFVHLHNPQQSGCTFGNLGHQCAQLRDLLIVRSRFFLLLQLRPYP